MQKCQSALYLHTYTYEQIAEFRINLLIFLSKFPAKIHKTIFGYNLFENFRKFPLKKPQKISQKKFLQKFPVKFGSGKKSKIFKFQK